MAKTIDDMTDDEIVEYARSIYSIPRVEIRGDLAGPGREDFLAFLRHDWVDRDTPVTTKTIEVGECGVDAGMIWLGDPCYVMAQGDSKPEIDYDGLLKALEGAEYPLMAAIPYRRGHPGLGCVVTSGHGDGIYPVTAEIEVGPRGSMVKSVTITFIEDDE